MANIVPKKGNVNKKLPEIERFRLMLKTLNIKTSDIAKDSGIPVRTINNYIWKNIPIGGQLLRHLYAKYNVSLDWLLCDRGNMLIDSQAEPRQSLPSPYPFAADIPAASYTVMPIGNARARRMCVFIDQFMSEATDDEQAWLEMQLKMHVPQYSRFLAEHHD
jgi:transcriptional regulator with XRE-family HTH domain